MENRFNAWLLALITQWTVLAATPAHSYSLLANADPTLNNPQKWDSREWGTGATITWSFMEANVNLAADPVLSYLSGTNTLGTGAANDVRKIIDIDQGHGVGAFDAAVERAFAAWSAVANITFVKVADSGSPAAGSATPDIRIGAFQFDPACCTGASGYGPPGYDDLFPDSLAGDIFINNLNNFQIAPGTEGDFLPFPGGIYANDVEGLLLHEIGHTLGLDHSNVLSGVMCGFQSSGFDGRHCHYSNINRELDPDDVAGIQFVYGTRPVPLPASLWLLGSAMASLALIGRRRS